MTSNSPILYQNTTSTVFLIDIPTSIALAQELSPESLTGTSSDNTTSQNAFLPFKETYSKKPRHLLSSAPLKTPYPASFEPKREAARAKVLARNPGSRIHEEIWPLASDALRDIRENYSPGSEWCLPRYLLQEDKAEDSKEGSDHSAWLARIRSGKREREKRRRGDEENCPWYSHDEDAQLYPEYFGIRACKGGPTTDDQIQPPVILSPGRNRFENETELCKNVVKNTSRETATVEIRKIFSVKSLREFNVDLQKEERPQLVIVPPLSSFILCNLPIPGTSRGVEYTNPIPSLPQDKKFNLIVLDPPWANKSVRRSGHYETQTYLDSELVMGYIRSILTTHSHFPSQDEDIPKDQSDLSIAAIWITNSAKAREAACGSLTGAGFTICEEWIWVKTTVDGQPVTPIEGVWRKPYEILVIGKRERGSKVGAAGGILRRVIAAVPDVHSRKPNLKILFERIFFTPQFGPGDVLYSAMEVFARNLTAGWWACGNEVLKFNSESWWVDD
ncbi:MT-A70-domain-containing protein [Aspergillus aurantiobrunneus]